MHKRTRRFVWTRRTLIVLGTIAVILLGLRIAAPYVVEKVIDDRLAALPGYWGSVDDVDLNLWRGAYEIENLRVIKSGSGRDRDPFLFVPRTEIGLQWGALFEGKIVSDVELDSPRMKMIVAKTDAATQTSPPKELAQMLLDATPLDINLFEVKNGAIHFIDERKEPKVDVSLDHLQLTAKDLSTRPSKKEGGKPSSAELTARVQGEGRVKAKGKGNMFAPEHPAVDVDLSLEGLPLTALKEFTNAYAGVEFKGGTLNVYTELAIAKRHIEGYVKPLIEGSKVDLNAKGDGPVELAWEVFVGAMLGVLENRQFDAVATRIPIEGRLDQPDVSVWSTVGELLANAFLKALLPRIDGTITLEQILHQTRPTSASAKKSS